MKFMNEINKKQLNLYSAPFVHFYYISFLLNPAVKINSKYRSLLFLTNYVQVIKEFK